MPIVPEGVHFSLRLIKGSLTTFNHSLEPSCEFDANWHHFFKMMPIGIIINAYFYFGRSSIEIPSTICLHTARSSMAVLMSPTSRPASLATISRNVSGLRPRLACCIRQGRMLEMVWSDALMQWPANRALRCARTVEMGGRSP